MSIDYFKFTVFAYILAGQLSLSSQVEQGIPGKGQTPLSKIVSSEVSSVGGLTNVQLCLKLQFEQDFSFGKGHSLAYQVVSSSARFRRNKTPEIPKIAPPATTVPHSCKNFLRDIFLVDSIN